MTLAKILVVCFAAFLIAPSCVVQPQPAPNPDPPVMNCSCADLCANLAKLQCSEAGSYCIANCEEADSQRAAHGIIPNHCCVTAAASCETARACE